MAQQKRKPRLQAGERGGFKKVKTGDAEELKKRPLKIAETETDSDPIVESSTVSESGEDDGVSWPSDGEDEGEVQWPEEELEEDNEDGGVEVAAEPVNGDKSVTKPKAEGAGNQCGSHATIEQLTR